MTSPRLFLASQSPRRRSLLSTLGVPFAVLESEAEWVDETPQPNESPRAYVERLARAKAVAGWQTLVARDPCFAQPHAGSPRALVLGADTAVALAEQILGKPATRDEAAAMLRALSGQTHEVLTAVALTDGAVVEVACSSSEVRFAPLPEAWIAAYVASGEPLDKAGAYAYQGAAAAFIPEIRGSASGIIGLPLFETAQLLARFGVGPHCSWKSRQ